jgi:hypothetical protein
LKIDRHRRWSITATTAITVETSPLPPSLLRFYCCRRWNIAATIAVENLPLLPLKHYRHRCWNITTTTAIENLPSPPPPLKHRRRCRHHWKFTATAAVAIKILPPPPFTHYCCGCWNIATAVGTSITLLWPFNHCLFSIFRVFSKSVMAWIKHIINTQSGLDKIIGNTQIR